MTAEQIYRAFDHAGLTPPVHWHAAPHEWRMVCEALESEIDNEIEHLFLLMEIHAPRGPNRVMCLRKIEAGK